MSKKVCKALQVSALMVMSSASSVSEVGANVV